MGHPGDFPGAGLRGSLLQSIFPPNWAQLVRLLDLAAECGGASHGLHPTSGRNVSWGSLKKRDINGHNIPWLLLLIFFDFFDYHSIWTGNHWITPEELDYFSIFFLCSGASMHPAFWADSRFVGTSHRLLKGGRVEMVFFRSIHRLGNLLK